MTASVDARPSVTEQPEQSRGSKRRVTRSSFSWLQHLVLAGLVLGLWEVAARTYFADSLFLAPVSEISQVLYDWFATGFIWPHLRTSMAELFLGFALSIVFGVLIGIVIGSSRGLYTLLNPWVAILYASPLVAITPLFILAFGIGIASKVALVFSVAVFPIIVNTSAGFRSVDTRYLELARSFSASRWMVATRVRLPASAPFIITGMRLASGRAVTGVVVAEFFVAQNGVGYLISLSSATFRAADLFAGVIIFAVVGLALFYFFELLEKRLASWRRGMVSQ